MSQQVFFQPPGAWVGDVVPWIEGGEFQLYYLHEQRVTPKPGTPWHLVTTTDFVHFTDQGEAFASGGPAAPDFNIYTGSVVEAADGSHHLFYTGQNSDHVGPDGQPLQLVMKAISTDGRRSWTRDSEMSLGATAGYETGDWRDPFVFRDEEAGIWRMLITARHDSGPSRRRGAIAQCTSTDLETWTPAEPFWDPRRYIAHECPEVFQMGDWWYLVYSEFSETFTTRYRMSRSLSGPWIVPEHDSLDGRAYYAAKSAQREGRRFFFGWIASKEGDRDDGDWQWAGTMSVLEAVQRTNGTLDFRLPHELLASFADEWIAPPLTLESRDGYEASILEEPVPDVFHLRVELDIDDATTECGVLLRSSDDGDESYILRLEPKRSRLVFDRWPRLRTGDAQWQVSGDVPFAVELERPCDLPPGRHVLDIVVEDTICVAVLDDSVCLSTRLYDRPTGRIGVFVGEGSATFTDIRLGVRAESAHN